MTARKDFRHDIQFLRGIAVLLVVLFHAFENAVRHGFLGVDVFFVISGFLVTGMILRELDAGRFTLAGFYFRRIRRIIPAALSTLIVTTLASYWILTSFEWDEYVRELLASVLFSANLLMSRRDGYFGPDPQTEPLRHFWSLAVEEQFYIVIPVLLMVLPARWRLRFIVGIAVASLLLCVVGSTVAPILTFYNLPTRAWELLAGALCSLAVVRARFTPPSWAGWLALAIIVLVSIIGIDDRQPRGDAIIVVAATCLVLLSQDEWLPRNRLTAPVLKVGDWSYSLYLVHWPLLCFVQLASGTKPAPIVLAGTLMISIVLGALQFRLVEQPFWRDWRVGDRRRWLQLGAMLALMVVVAVPAAMWVLAGAGRAQVIELRPRLGVPGCDDQVDTGLMMDRCRTGEHPTIAVWGDSYAMHIIDGIQADPLLKDQLLQVTNSGCAPVLGTSALSLTFPLSHSARCIVYNQHAVAALAMAPVRVVVISSPFKGVLGDDGRKILRGDKIVPWTPAMANGLIEAIRTLRRAGKAVVIVGPTPHEELDVARCNIQVEQGLLMFGRRDCAIPLAGLDAPYRQVAAALPAVARATGSWLLMPADVLCTQHVCVTKIGRKLVYRDGGHLTEFGSIHVVSHLGLNSLLRRLVREPGLQAPDD